MGRALFVLAAATLCCSSAVRAAPTFVITARGVHGVRPGVSLAQVKARLGATFAGDQYGNELDGAVCSRTVNGEAFFAIRSDGPRLGGIAFTAGVMTKEGIQPGSTLRQLLRVYGTRLVLDDDPDIHAADSDVLRPSGSGEYPLVFTVDTQTHRVLAIGLRFGNVLGVHCPTAASRPPSTIGVLSLDGASGLKPVMPEGQVLTTWPWFPTLTDGAGSGSETWMPVCADPVRGAATFGGGALGGVWFYSGASTDTGITIGSTLDQLKATYGADLTATDSSNRYLVVAKGGPPTATLGFQLKDGVVAYIGFGGLAGLGVGAGRTWC